MKHIFILVGPSGCGKTLLSNYIHEKYQAVEFISTTTREVDHVNYHFVTKETFEEMIEKHKLCEFAEYAGNYYGLSEEAVYSALEKNDICVAVMEMRGALSIQYLFKNNSNVKVHLIFIHARLSTLFLRMVDRGDSKEKIAERLDNIITSKELLNGSSCDYTIFNDGDIRDAEKNVDKIFEKILKNSYNYFFNV